jgi:hypothetical protein
LAGYEVNRPASVPVPSAPGSTGTKRVLWIVVIAIAALVLVFWDQPTGKVIIGITPGVLVALVIIEFLSRPPGRFLITTGQSTIFS